MIKQYAISVDKMGLDLLEEEDELSAKSLHKIRAATKRLRGLWKFAEPEIGKKKSREAQRRLRDLAKMLSKERDLKVMRDTLASFDKFLTSEKLQKSVLTAETVIAKQSQNGKINNVKRMKLLTRAFARDLKEWKSLGQHTNGIRLDRRLGDTYGRAFGLREESWKTGDIKIFHKWRRWAKYLRYQFEAVEIGQSPWRKANLRGLRKLGRALGQRQDLYVLRTFIESSGRIKKKDRSRLIKLIEAADAKAVRQCRRLSDSLFELAPKCYRKRVKTELRQCGLLEC